MIENSIAEVSIGFIGNVPNVKLIGKPATNSSIEPYRMSEKDVPQRLFLLDLFKNDRIVFAKNKMMRFYSSPNTDTRDDLFPLDGKHSFQYDRINFRAFRKSSLGANVTFDGFVRRKGDKWHLEAIYTLTSITGNRFAFITQDLSPDPNANLNLDGRKQQAEVANEEKTDSVFDLEMPIFDVTIQPTEGFENTSPHHGQLMFVPDGDKYFQLSLVSKGALVPGWINWDSKNLQQAGFWEGNHLRLALVDDRTHISSTVQWYTKADQSPLSLRRIKMDLVYGTDYSISGFVIAEDSQAHTYRLRISGVAQGRGVEVLKSRLDSVDPSGEWQVKMGKWESVSLQHSGNRLTGTFKGSKAISIDGILDGSRVDFHWNDETGDAGVGFLRIMPGTLSAFGILTDHHHSEVIMVERSNKIELGLDTVGTKEMMSLRQLGQNLAMEGRCYEASRILSRASELYEEGWTKFNGSSAFNEGHLISKLFLLNYQIQCDFTLQDYDGLLRHLEEVVALRRRLSANVYVNSIVKDQVDNVKGSIEANRLDLTAMVNTLEAFERNLEDGVLRAAALALNSTLLSAVSELDQVTSFIKAATNNIDREDSVLNVLVSKLRDMVSELQGLSDGALKHGEDIYANFESLLDARSQLITDTRHGEQINTSNSEGLEQSIVSKLHRLGKLKNDEKNFFAGQMKAAILLKRIAAETSLIADHVSRIETTTLKNGYKRAAETPQLLSDLSIYIEKWRSLLDEDLSKIQAVDKALPFYEKLVTYLYELGAPEDALVISEMARTRAFLDLLEGRNNVRKLRRDVDSYNTPSPESTTLLHKSDILEIVRTDKSTIVEYFVTDERLYIWVVSPTGSIHSMVQELKREELSGLIKELRVLAEQETFDEVRFHDTLRSLHNALIAPIKPDWLPKDALITIVPHGELFHVPFAALAKERNNFLIKQHTLTYSPAIATLPFTRKNADNAKNFEKKFVAFVNPEPLADSQLNSLPLIDTEELFPWINQFYNSDRVEILSRQRANKKTLRRIAPDATVLHFATHAVVIGDSPESSLRSYIALAKSNNDDGYFRVADVFDLKLNSDLVILGGCRTAGGDTTGDGVIGFSRAFTLAGAATLVMNLWEVTEKASLDLMYRFHENLNKGLSKAQALQQAQLQMLGEEVRVWASFVMYGEGV